jgi:hypothetical protein
MRAGLSFSHSPISLLLRQPLSIKKSYAGAIQREKTVFLPFQKGFLTIVCMLFDIQGADDKLGQTPQTRLKQ